MEVPCSNSRRDSAGVTVQVSSPSYSCTLYTGSGHIHEDMGIPFFADHIGALTGSFDSKLADMGTPSFDSSADTYADRGLTPVS